MNLDIFFKPKSVAVIGASRSPQKVGHVIYRNFLESGFKGQVYPINPETDQLLGRKCWPNVSAIGKAVDLAIIAIPAQAVPQALIDCGKAGVKAVIVISAGFKEVGNVQLENRIKEIVRKYKMAMIGPNCLGVYDPRSGVDTFFLPRYKLERPGPGSISFISQSGALGSVMLDWMAMKGYRISKFVSYGNAADVDESDILAYLASDPETKVIAIYTEGINGGRKFFNIAKRIAKRKAIIALKAGITKEGSSATLSHTGSLAGQPEIYSAAFKQIGIIEAKTLEQIFDFGRIITTQPLPNGPRVQIVTNGGGFGVLTTDAVVKAGLEIAKLCPQSIKKLKQVMPGHVVISNPLDLTGDADVTRYAIAIDTVIRDPAVDIIFVIALFQTPTLTPDIVETLKEVNGQKPIIVISAGGRYTEVLKKSLEDVGIPCFSYPNTAAEAAAALWQRAKFVK
jgi:acetyl coenzyme A synthetase (ADP forming)-like protein